MKVGILNDNKKKLNLWPEFTPKGTLLFTHPEHVFNIKNKDPEIIFDVLVLDRMIHGEDILEGSILSDLRETYPDVKLVLASALHVQGENIPGIDLVIDQWPISFEEILRLLRMPE